jgi:aspartyl-tRNA(Asn)/glutamyl-tRNA(Gln) amidotransferase subunit C
MDVTEPLVRHVAKLARLDLSDAEVAGMVHELGRILHHVEAVASVDLGGAQPATAEPVPSATLRPDEPAESLERRGLLANAPAHDQVFFLVPRVLGDD